MDFQPTDKKRFEEESKRNPRFVLAYEMLLKGMATRHIANQLGVSPPTIRAWFNKASVPPRRFAPLLDGKPETAEELQKRVQEGEDVDSLLDAYNHNTIAELKRHASNKEDEVMAEIAAAQSTPADKYQHYIAAAGIKLLRDSIKHLKGPRTVKELSELDQLIRRNLGLNARTGGGQSRMTIDISILNNGVADKGGGAIARMKKDVVEAELVDSDGSDE